ncbi:MAG: YggT family protein [Chloroflexi bacterium]|nr:YggT family protein [Chloroflexota bacterium]
MSTKIKKEEVYIDADGSQPELRRRRQVIHDQDAERRIAVRKVANFVWLLFGILNVLLVFRFALKLMGANPENAFADFIYDLSELFVSPFVGLIESPTSGDLIFDVPVLVAIIVYSLVGWILVQLIWLLLYHPGERVISTFEESD